MKGIVSHRIFAIVLGSVVGGLLGLVVVRALSFSGLPMFGAPVWSGATEQPTATATAAVPEVSSARRPTTPRAAANAPPPFRAIVAMRRWPAEPASPAAVDPRRFADSFVRLCGSTAPEDAGSVLGPAVLAAATGFDVDPFLLAAIVFRASRCGLTRAGGLTGMDAGLYAADVAQGTYRFPVLDESGWHEETLALDRFDFAREAKATTEAELYFAAGFLRAWERAHRGIDSAFPQAPHRHAVSHFVFGDAVKGSRPESAILVDRRRILEYYHAIEPRPPVDFRGVALACPLDGAPRIVTSDLGEIRADGARLHRGNDFESTFGEPVRAAAPGKVIFAGVDLPGPGHRRLELPGRRAIELDTVGAGGLYVCIEHRPDPELLVTCSMHLDRITVRQGRHVERGELIGYVGNTGIRESGPHLHFEVHTPEGPVAAIDALPGLALGARLPGEQVVPAELTAPAPAPPAPAPPASSWGRRARRR